MVVRPLIRENLRRVSAILNCKKLVSSPPTLSALPLQSLGAVSISVDDHAQIEDGTVSFGQQHGICLLLVRYVAATTTQDGEPHCPPRRSPARFLQLMLTAFTGTIRLLDDRAVLVSYRCVADWSPATGWTLTGTQPAWGRHKGGGRPLPFY